MRGAKGMTLSAAISGLIHRTELVPEPKQVTDANLLGLAVRDGLVLSTMEKATLHLAGKEHGKHVLLLEKK